MAAVFTGHRPVQRLQITDRWSWPPFGKANLGVVIDHLTGEFAGYEFAELTYAYTGRRAGQSVIGVTVVGLPVGLPPLQVGPDSRATFPIPGLLSYDLNLRNETFNRPLRVQAQDLRYATDMLNPRAVEALLTVEPFIWRIDGCDLIAFSQPLRDPAQILRRLEVLTTITAYIPSFVLDDHGTDSCHCIPNEHGHHRP